MHRTATLTARLLALGLLAAAPRPAAAQATEAERTALARSLFREGVALAAEERFPEAAERFRRVRALQPTPGVAYNLAAALDRMGKLVEASELLREVVGSPESSLALQEQSRDLLARLEARLARLTVHVEGPAESASLHIDGAPLSAAALGVSMPVDPGTHVLEARRDGGVVAREEVDLSEGGAAEVTLALPVVSLDPEVAPAGPAPPPVLPPPEPDGGSGGGFLSSPWVWAAAAILVVGGVLGGLYLAGTFDPPAPVTGNADPGVLEWD